MVRWFGQERSGDGFISYMSLCVYPLLQTALCRSQAWPSLVWSANGPCRPGVPLWAPALPTLLMATDVLARVQLTSAGNEMHHCPERDLKRALTSWSNLTSVHKNH
ncbi:hypothetical protein WMY93_018522 [Mugilogobius chulae]|uniref:Uncharacterized protein n=1 Tax=Mugilogobius chulae TaxID=88201 RepID=A0AAW0NKE4_9GOBI